MMKKALAAAALALSALTAAGCGGGASGDFTVAYANHNDDDAFGSMIREAFRTKAASSGLNVEFYDAKGDANLQTDQLKEMIDKKIGAIVLLAVDGTGVIPTVEKANEAGIPIIAINRDVNGGKFIGVYSNDVEAGRLQGEYFKKNLPPNATVVYLEGTATQGGAQKRWEGFSESCLKQRPDVKLLSMMDGDYSRAEAMKIMSVWLSIFPQINAVVAGNDEMALGAVAALKAANRLEGTMVSGVDATEDALKAIAAGEMVQTVKQDAVGQAEGAVEIAAAVKAGNIPSEGKTIPFTSITKENLNQFLK